MKNEMIRSASIMLTEDCNLHCPYCFFKDTLEKGKSMSKEMSEKIIDFLIEGVDKNEKKITVTFFGGEPLLNIPVMKHMTEYGYKRTKEEGISLICEVITNCTIFTEEYGELIKYWRDKLDRFYIQLSIDGIPEVLDVNRSGWGGKPSSNMITSTAKKYSEFFKENHIPSHYIAAHGVITKQSLPFYKQSYDYIRDELGIDSCWFMPLHEEEWSEEDIVEFERQTRLIGDRVILDCLKDNTDKYFHDFSTFRCALEPHRATRACGAGLHFCDISTDGNIYPCHRFYSHDPSHIMGTIDGGLDPNYKNEFKEITLENVMGLHNCAKCPNTNCKICLAANQEVNGDMRIGFPKYCKMSIIEDRVRWYVRKTLEKCGLLESLPNEDKYLYERTFLEYSSKVQMVLAEFQKEIEEIKSLNSELIDANIDLLNIVEGLSTNP